MGISHQFELPAILRAILEVNHSIKKDDTTMDESILDEHLEIKSSDSYILSIVLVFSTIFIWVNLKGAGSLPYDENYGLLLVALIASTITSFMLLYYYFKAREVVFKNWLASIGFLLSASPIYVVYVCFHYEEIFGLTLAN